MRGLKRWLASGILLGALVLAMSASAVAAPTTVTLTVGPVAVPNLPLSLCVTPVPCVTTPPAQSVSLTASVTLTNGLTLIPPVILPGTCPTGQVGVKLNIITFGTGTLTISGFLTVVVNGSPIVIPIGPISTPSVPFSLTTISACTTLPLPTLPLPLPLPL